MNRENLLKIRDLMLTEKVSKSFNIERYRDGDKTSHECNSVGCATGHATILDDNFLTDPKYFRKPSGNIDFRMWSYHFTELKHNEWSWLFSGYWKIKDNTSEGVAKRIDTLLNQGLPEGWSNKSFLDNPFIY